MTKHIILTDSLKSFAVNILIVLSQPVSLFHAYSVLARFSSPFGFLILLSSDTMLGFLLCGVTTLGFLFRVIFDSESGDLLDSVRDSMIDSMSYLVLLYCLHVIAVQTRAITLAAPDNGLSLSAQL